MERSSIGKETFGAVTGAGGFVEASNETFFGVDMVTGSMSGIGSWGLFCASDRRQEIVSSGKTSESAVTNAEL